MMNNGAKNQTQRRQVPARPQLAAVKRGKIERPPRVLMYGSEGCGKTTWASQAPSPVFMCAEDGTSQLDVPRLPEPRGWEDVIDAIDELATAEHDFKTLVIDTLDWLEPLCWEYICARDGKANIETYGYSKGQNVVAINEWRILLAKLEVMCRTKGMGVIMIGHCWVKPFKSPDSEDYDRYELAMHNKAGGLLKQWCDAVLFARFETFADTKEKTGRTRGVSTGARIVHTSQMATWDAKNRYDLPEVMPLDWHVFDAAMKAHRPADPAQLQARITELVGQLSDESVRARVEAAVASAAGNAATLARIADRLSAETQIARGE